MDLSAIEYCRIHPGVGIARVGNSPLVEDDDDYILGPETLDTRQHAPHLRYKDAAGRMKRKGARFRVYAYDKEGRALGEVTNEHAAITWRVELANVKAAAQKFQSRFFIGPAGLRNQAIKDRSSLQIRPSSRTIAGCKAEAVELDDGTFGGVRVPLGTLLTDDVGRLIVLGGYGFSSAVPQDAPIGLDGDGANSDGWHDDVSDGLIQAEVTLRGDGNERVIRRVDRARVVVAPPDYAPFTTNIVTLYDVMEDVAIEARMLEEPADCIFERDVVPILQRAAGYVWVSGAANRGHGDAAFVSPARLKVLRDPSASAALDRQAFFDRIRDPNRTDGAHANPSYMPQLWGDNAAEPASDPHKVPAVGDPTRWLALTKTQYRRLKRWASGDFVDTPWRPAPFAELGPADQATALDRAALEACAGGSFHPGVEMSYAVLDPATYAAPFRLAESFEAGDVTARMAVPWQVDSFDCGDNWWPAQRPNQVVTEELYAAAVREYAGKQAHDAKNRDMEPFLAMLAGRVDWDRDVENTDTTVLMQRASFDDSWGGEKSFVVSWSDMGFVLPRRHERDVVFVETERSPFAAVTLRESFYRLVNIDQFPDFLPKAREIADRYLQQAQRFMARPDIETPQYHPFVYSKNAFDERLMEIYIAFQRDAASYRPGNDAGFPDREGMVNRILQLAPFNQLDGAWLSSMTQAGPIDEVSALLFSIWRDEVGDGDPSLNHANIYTTLMRSVGLYLPDIHTRDYAYYKGFMPEAFIIPVFELAIALFPFDYYPELLGMTLNLEWEVLSLRKTAKRMEYFGLDPQFYTMHIGIDNAADGHGAMAKRAVELYLDSVRKSAGNDAMQKAWARIWTGYVAFATSGNVGGLIKQMNKELRKRRAGSPVDRRAALSSAVHDLIRDKAPFGQWNHGSRRLGDSYINDLFEDPTSFMEGLVEVGMILPGDPEHSPFFSKIGSDGPMFRVFTPAEIQLWWEWTRSLADTPCGSGSATPDPPPPAYWQERMEQAVEHLRGRQVGDAMHRAVALSGFDERGDQVTKALADWLDGDPRAFLRVLRDPANQVVLPGHPEESPFLTDRLSLDTPMGRVWNDVAPNSEGRTWREIAAGWIAAKCPVAGDTPAAAEKLLVATERFVQRRGQRFGRHHSHEVRPYGMEAVH